MIDIAATGPRVLQALHGRQVIAHNYGFEFSFLSKLGVEPSRGDCTAQLARLLLGPFEGDLETAASGCSGSARSTRRNRPAIGPPKIYPTRKSSMRRSMRFFRGGSRRSAFPASGRKFPRT